MNTTVKRIYLIATLVLIPLFPRYAITQIVPDATLPDNSVVNTTGNVSEITGGTTQGANLFHSFQDFSVGPVDEAFFNNAVGIENILGRITGSNISNIEGLIRANGIADLFLINPNGFVFSEGATLDIGGSFTAASGDAVTFEDGSSFNAVAPEESILSISAPLGVQLGAQPGDITVTGSESQVFFGESGATITEFRNQGLTNNLINLYAGNIGLEGGNLTGLERVNLGAGTNGTVEINNPSANNFQQSGNITLNSASSIASDVKVNIDGNNVEVNDGSSILALDGAEGIDINARNFIVSGESSFGDFPSYVSTDSINNEQPAGNININANNAIASGGGQVNAATFTSAPGGNVTITAANTILAQSGGSITGSAFLADSYDIGNAGSVNLNAPTVAVNFGGQVGSSSFGSGEGGTINVTANLIEVDGEESGQFPAEIFSRSQGEGNAGTINLNAGELRVTNGGQVSTTAFSSGAGGTININADSTFVGNTVDSVSPEVDTGIFAASGTGEVTPDKLGDGGVINLQSDDLTLSNQGLISTSTFSAGNSGDINITAENLEIATSPNSLAAPLAGLLTSVARSDGNGGNIKIDAQNIQIRDGGQIVAGTVGSGNAGNITIESDTINATGFGEDGNSGIISSAVIGSGNGGNIDITAQSTTLNEGGTINASNFSTANTELAPGTGRAGTINLNSNEINILGQTEPTSINATTNVGGGGNINLSASESISLTGSNAKATVESQGSSSGGTITLNTPELNLQEFGAITSSASSTGDAGNITVNAKRINGDRGLITAESIISGGGDITITSDDIRINNNSLISTSVLDSNGGGGNINIDNKNLILARNNSDIRANAVEGPGGNINIKSLLLFTDFDSDIDASSRFGLDGNVIIRSPESEKELSTAILPENVVDPTGLISAACPISGDNSFAVTGNGGIAKTPMENQSIDAPWVDNDNTNGNTKVEKPSSALQEAGTAIVTKNGEVQLVATRELQSPIESGCR